MLVAAHLRAEGGKVAYLFLHVHVHGDWHAHVSNEPWGIRKPGSIRTQLDAEAAGYLEDLETVMLRREFAFDAMLARDSLELVEG